jgi:hypothetical protein
LAGLDGLGGYPEGAVVEGGAHVEGREGGPEETGRKERKARKRGRRRDIV